MALLAGIAVVVAALYILFVLWYGGNGKPLTRAEIDEFLRQAGANARTEHDRAALDEVAALIAKDDGREFVMQNLVRYRPKALYPPGYSFDDNPRAADQRYARAIMWPLLRYGNHPVFIARRSGTFIEPLGADAWHYVAMVRYRSRRDLLRFALDTQRADIFVHKWAAIEKTHVFPVQPIASMIFVRVGVGLLLTLAGAMVYLIFR